MPSPSPSTPKRSHVPARNCAGPLAPRSLAPERRRRPATARGATRSRRRGQARPVQAVARAGLAVEREVGGGDPQALASASKTAGDAHGRRRSRRGSRRRDPADPALAGAAAARPDEDPADERRRADRADHDGAAAPALRRARPPAGTSPTGAAAPAPRRARSRHAPPPRRARRRCRARRARPPAARSARAPPRRRARVVRSCCCGAPARRQRARSARRQRGAPAPTPAPAARRARAATASAPSSSQRERLAPGGSTAKPQRSSSVARAVAARGGRGQRSLTALAARRR